MRNYWWVVFTVSLVAMLCLPNEAQAKVWIPDDEFLSYIDSDGFFTVVGAIKNSEKFAVSPTIIINIQEENKIISKPFEYTAVPPSRDLPFKIKFPEINTDSASLLKPDVSFVPIDKEQTQVMVIYDKTLVTHDDGHLTGMIINNGTSPAHNIKVLAIVWGSEKILDMAQNIEMIDKLEPGEITSFSMYPDPSISSEISYYSCFAPSDTTIVPMHATRNGEKYFFRYDSGSWYYAPKFNDDGTELTMKTQTSFNLKTYANFAFQNYTDNEEFQVFLNSKPKQFIQSWDPEEGNWHVAFTVEPFETGELVIKGFAEDWQPKQPILPDWLRNNAKWWADDKISDNDFVLGIQYMIKEEIIQLPKTQSEDSSVESQVEQIPKWIKINADWWGDSIIEEDSFIQGIQFLIKNEIIRV